MPLPKGNARPDPAVQPVRHGSDRRSHAGAIVALAALAVAVAAWFWTTRQPPQPEAGIGLPHGIIVAGCGAFVAALIAELRAMSLADILEAVWDGIAGLFVLIGAVLKGIWNGILSLFGWD